MDSHVQRPIPSDPPLAPPVTTGTSPRPDTSPGSTDPEGTRLEQILPQIKDLARKVGGMRRLAIIVQQLDQGGE